MRIGVHKVLMNSPSDVSGLERLIDDGAIESRVRLRRGQQRERLAVMVEKAKA